MIGSKEFAWRSAEPFRSRTNNARAAPSAQPQYSPFRLDGVMSQYSTLARNGPRRRREDLAQRTPRNAGMSWESPRFQLTGVMSQYSTLVSNGPGRTREDLAQRTPRNAGMSWGEPKVPARRGHVSIFNIGAQPTEEKKRRPRRGRQGTQGMSDTVESATAPNKPIFLESHRLRASRDPCEWSPRKGCQSF
jgi:hypothetical protein